MPEKLLAPHRVPLVINDRIDIALARGGRAWGQSDFPLEDERKLLSPDVLSVAG